MRADNCERRKHARVAADRACKVYDPRSRRYTAGRTIDLSRGGLRLRLDRELPVGPGKDLYVALAHRSHPGILNRTEFSTARVVWVSDSGIEVAVAMSDLSLENEPVAARAA